MPEFICEYCGKTFAGGNISHSYRFCSRSCAVSGRGSTYDAYLDWELKNGKWQCPYNEGVACRNRVCVKCGWNPAVDRERRRDLNG